MKNAIFRLFVTIIMFVISQQMFPQGIKIDESNIPDANFRAWIIDNIPGADDGYLSETELTEVTTIEIYNNYNIRSLEGVELFENLSTLFVRFNQIATFDGSEMKSLRSLSLPFNQITDVKFTPDVTSLSLNNNMLSQIDLKQNVNLRNLNLDNNQLRKLDVSNNPELTHLHYGSNKLLNISLINNQKVNSWSSGTQEIDVVMEPISEGIGFEVPDDFNVDYVNSMQIDNNNVSGYIAKENGKLYFILFPLGTNESVIDGKVLTYQYYTQNTIVGYMPVCVTLNYKSEEQPIITTYDLSITSKGNGSASYGGETIRGATKTYTVNEGASETITFTPDDGYRIKSLKVDGSAVTASTSYTVTVNANTTVEVEFEAIPVNPSNYSLSITAIGSGALSYGGETIRGATKTYTVTEGTTATLTITPDSGYRIKSLKVNGSSVSATNSYSLTINSDTTIEVEFEEIPDTPSVTSYTLSITASGNGSANYGGESIRGTSRSYTLNEGSSVSISFTPDEGYQIENVKVNGSNIGTESSYSTKINANTTVEVVFEAIPVTTYTLTVTASGSGIATFNGTEVRNGSYAFTVNEGSDAIILFTPDKGYKVDMVKADGNEVEVSESYTISNITSDKTLEVVFAEMDRNFSIDGGNYQIESFEDNSVTLTGVQNSISFEVSDKINYQAQDWNIIGISENALENCEELAAIIWNPEIPFTAKVANPNLLLYVKDEAYAPAGIRNVVVNGFAKAITLTDAQSGNNFYCPSAFMTQSIIYTHNYSMKTGINESKGWETIALPFDVQQISHSGKGEIIPFAKWNADNDSKPFWLYELTGTGFVEAEELKANTPYIISMPNNDLYPNDYQLSGRVTFSALNAEVKKSDDIQTATFGNNTFVPAFTSHNAESGYYALNVNNDFETYQGSANVGSKFILNLRRIHPFEAYLTSTSGTRSIDIFDSMTTGIRDVLDITDSQKTQKVYDLSGRLITIGTSLESIRQELPAGVYIINNKKMIIK